MNALTTALAIFVVFCLLVQLVSVVLAQIKQGFAAKDGLISRPKITVLRPVCGLENNLAETLASSFGIQYPDFEILFCVADPCDPVVALVQRLIAAHPAVQAQLLIGEDRISGNPKLNNLAKGWARARGDWVVMVDSNVLLPRDALHRLLAAWRPGTGLVTSPPAGLRPIGFAARLECGFLNSFQGRWQLASAALGNGFAQGKILFWQRDFLNAAGGLAALGHEMAEDVAATKLVRAAGLQVRLTRALFDQPIGARSFGAVWRRQLRWAKVRRLGFARLYLAEILAGAALPVLAAAILAALGVIAPSIVLALALLWYGAELALARASGWPAGPLDLLAWLCRDAILPGLWLAAWVSDDFDWRGNRMRPEDVPPAAAGAALAKP